MRATTTSSNIKTSSPVNLNKCLWLFEITHVPNDIAKAKKISRRGQASLSIEELIAVKPLCWRSDHFRAAIDSPSKNCPLTFQT